jgi:dihydroorotate dehydrogenase (NAD+) catalytic subunit
VRRLSTTVGSVALPAPIMTASGTAGHGAELAAYGDLGELGAVVVKSLSADPWPGNAAPRVHGHDAGAWMLNSVGLQGPGVESWRRHDLPALHRAGARVVASIWGRTVDDYAKAADGLGGSGVVAVEVNLSCPNLDGGRHLFAQSADDSAAVVAAVRAVLPSTPVWAKLTAACTSIVDVAGAVADAGADAVVCVNTLLGMAIDVETRRYRLGAGGGGVSGTALHPIAVRAVHDVHAALPALPIVGVGGVSTGVDAVELLMAGASAVGVGTATFADPRACWRVQDEVASWCESHGVRAVAELIGAAGG